MQGLSVERLDHLGVVAGICQEIGLTEYLDALAGPSQQQVSIRTATVAMILNGLGFSNRRLYMVSPFFATKPVEHLLGPGITAEMLHDDCLGRTLDWLYAHDPTTLCAGIARQARQRFGISARQVHVDTTSFSVTGKYTADLDAHTLAVTYGYSRDHRADLTLMVFYTAELGDLGTHRGRSFCGACSCSGVNAGRETGGDGQAQQGTGQGVVLQGTITALAMTAMRLLIVEQGRCWLLSRRRLVQQRRVMDEKRVDHLDHLPGDAHQRLGLAAVGLPARVVGAQARHEPLVELAPHAVTALDRAAGDEEEHLLHGARTGVGMLLGIA